MKFLYKEFVSEYFRKEESKKIKEMNAIPVIFEVLENINSDTISINSLLRKIKI